MIPNPPQNLYLASYAKVVMNKIAKHVAPTKGNFQGLKAIFVPTAADPCENRDFVEADRKALENYGAKIEVLNLKSVSTAEISQKLAAADILLIADGNTFYPMNQTIKSGAAKPMKANKKRPNKKIKTTTREIGIDELKVLS